MPYPSRGVLGTASIGTSTSQSPQLCTTCPSPIRIAAVVMVFFRLPQGKVFLATIDMVAPVSNTPRYSRPPSRIRTQNTRS